MAKQTRVDEPQLTLESLAEQIGDLRIQLGSALATPTNQETDSIRATVGEAVSQLVELRDRVDQIVASRSTEDGQSKVPVDLPELLYGCIKPSDIVCSMLTGAVQGMIAQNSVGALRDSLPFCVSHTELVIKFALVAIERLAERGLIQSPGPNRKAS